MNKLRAGDHVEFIVNSPSDIPEFTNGLSRDRLKADRRTQKAVVMSLIEIAEAAAKISPVDPELISQSPGIPWRNMKGMRNRSAHGYFDINLDIVLDTVTAAIPDLHKQTSDLLDQLRSDRKTDGDL